jgi:N-acetylmuramoyl-L-alanine amidase CwlA
MYLVGEHDTGKHTDYVGLYCSHNYGRTWHTC